jgi:aspartate aminotransferase
MATTAAMPDRTTAGRVIDLSLGDPGYAPPPEAKLAVARGLAAGNERYAPPGGMPRLRAACAEKLRTRNGIDARPDEVIITTGASLGLFCALAASCSPGDTVLVPDPGFPLYLLMAETLRLRPRRYALREDAGFEPDWDDLAELASGARVLIWNSPSNPIGIVARQDWVDRLGQLMARNPDLVLLSDEVYEDTCLDSGHISPRAAVHRLGDRIVSLFSFSKGYAMTGWRVGYLHAPADQASRLARIHWGVSMSTPSASQRAALAALGAGDDYLAGIRDHLRLARAQALAWARHRDFPAPLPEGGFFLWPDVSSSGLDGGRFCDDAIGECGVLMAPGTDFSPAAASRVRLSFAASQDDLREALARLDSWLEGRQGEARG